MYARATADANPWRFPDHRHGEYSEEQCQLSLTRRSTTTSFGHRPVGYPNHSMFILPGSHGYRSDNICGGISKTTYSWWRNMFRSVTLASAGVLQAIRQLNMDCTNGVDKPDLALCDADSYVNIEGKLQPPLGLSIPMSSIGVLRTLPTRA